MSHISNECWCFCFLHYQNTSFLIISRKMSHLNLCLPQNCSPLGSLPSVWTLLWPQGALPLWLSLSTPLRQQDVHVLLPPQQHRLQILLQRDRVPDGHADQPHHHLRRLCTQVSIKINHIAIWPYLTPFTLRICPVKCCVKSLFSFYFFTHCAGIFTRMKCAEFKVSLAHDTDLSLFRIIMLQ